MSAEAKYRIRAKDETKGALRSVKGNLGGIDKTLGALKGSMLGVFGAVGMGFLIKSTIGSIKAGAKSLDELAKAAKRVGMASEDLDAWTYAAELAGSSATGLQGGLKKLSITMYDVLRGSAESIAAFKDIGVEVLTSSGNLRDMNAVLFDLADRFQKQENATLKAALAQRVLGRGGMELIPMLNQGSEAIKAQLAEASALGLRYGDLTGEGEDLVDAQLRWGRALRSVKDTIYREVMPSLTDLTNKLAVDLMDALTGTDQAYREWLARRGMDPGTAGLEAMMNKRLELYEQLRNMEEEHGDWLTDAATRTGGKKALTWVWTTGGGKEAEAFNEYKEYLGQLELLDNMIVQLNLKLDLQATKQRDVNAAVEEAKNLAAEITGTYDEHIKSHEEYNKLLDEGRRLTLANRTAEEVYSDTIAKLQKSLDGAAISQETFNRAAEKAAERLRSATAAADDFDLGFGDVVKTAQTLEDELKGISKAAGRDLAHSFIDAITDVENAFAHLGDFASNILRQIAAAILTHNIFDPIFAALPYGGGTSTPPAGGEIASSIIFNVNAIDAASFNDHIAQRKTRELITGIVRESAQRSGRGSRL